MFKAACNVDPSLMILRSGLGRGNAPTARAVSGLDGVSNLQTGLHSPATFEWRSTY